ncbi:hypothetical protein C8D88_105454 [Lentzea atacamensis]|uniref:Neutral/alkaline non-lysosomal ceramidase N-terminal domain-containing protein n=1 Tax=Lentzea atacamensis TaxID=531938 RepID=A0A316I7J9_9PSEU|nr:hypothetical protein [Lentzea atacamensis]PWK86405.1 hypothetical protein C8D88_105454 [Lentzea atacamensis]
MPFRAGSAKVDVTPPESAPYLGGQPRHSLFLGVHDPLFARATAITNGETVIVIAVDSLGINNSILGPGRDFTAEVRERVQQQTGVPPSHVMIASSHAHSSPETADFRPFPDQAWLATFRDRIVQAAREAVENQRPVTATIGTGEVLRGTLAINRNAHVYIGAPPEDPEVTVVRFRGDEWSSVFYHFTTHPVYVQVQPYVSADFPGVTSAMLEHNEPHCQAALFLPGAMGNQSPPPDPLTHGGPHFDAENNPDFEVIRNLFAHTTRMGMYLAQTALEVPEETELTGPVTAAQRTIQVASRDLPDRGPFEVELAARRRALQDAIDRNAPKAEIVGLTQEVQDIEELLVAIDRGTDPIDAEVQVLRIGELALAGLPGEPFVELGFQLKDMSGDGRTVLPVGYANNYLGYLTHPEAWDTPVYEVSLGPWTRIGRFGGQQLTDTAKDLVDELWTTPNE